METIKLKLNKQTYLAIKLFNTSLTTHYLATLISKLNRSYSITVTANSGKVRIGKTTLTNNLVYIFKGNSGEKILYFKEEENSQSVTSGADYYILTDDIEKKHYIFIDLEGTGSANDKELEKLYFLVCSISNVLIINVEKAYTDITFTTFLQKIVTNLELQKLPVPKLYIVIRDCSLNAIFDLIPENKKTLDNLSKIKLAKEIIASKISNKYIEANRLFFISRPIYPDNSEPITNDKNSQYYKDTVEFANELKKNLPFEKNLENAEYKLNYAMNCKLNEYSDSSYINYQKELITNLLNKHKNTIFNKATKGNLKRNLLLIINKKNLELVTIITEQIKKLFFNSIEKKSTEYIKEQVDKITNQIVAEMNIEYEKQKNAYLSDRERTKTKPKYTDEIEYYSEMEPYHPKNLENHCSKCYKVYGSSGCTNDYSHKGQYTYTEEIHRFLGIFFETSSTRHHYWTCCNRKNVGDACT